MQPHAERLFEVSWEVCNKVGGIYRVLESKAAQIVKYYGQSYVLIGPYFPDKAKGEFRKGNAPAEFKEAFRALEKEGISCRYGNWLVEGEPQVILIDNKKFFSNADKIKTEMWEKFKIDSLEAAFDYTEPVVWSWAAGKVIEKLAASLKGKTVAQFHEWLAGAGLLYLKANAKKIGTVFTTHATTLGRTLANSNVPLYDVLNSIEPEKEAYVHHVQAKHQLEKCSANKSDVFTTVSEVTAMEAEKLLGRKVDVVLPNGLDLGEFPTFEELEVKHKIHNERMKEFAISYFFPYYTFDIQKTLFFFMSSRYEFRNKGMDIYIKALGLLNDRLKTSNSDKTVVAYFWVPADAKAIRQDIIDNREHCIDIKDVLAEVSEDITEEVFYAVAAGQSPAVGDLMNEDLKRELEKKLLSFRREGTPPLVTHELVNTDDIIVKSFQEAGLLNRDTDRVKVIFYPVFLSGADGLLNLDFYEAIQGSHLGIFPSFYEPWGYTPLETAALGVGSVTTDVSGLGKFFMTSGLPAKKWDSPQGVFVLQRMGQEERQTVFDLANLMHSVANFSRQELSENEIQAHRLAALADWSLLIKYYIEAHNRALGNQ